MTEGHEPRIAVNGDNVDQRRVKRPLAHLPGADAKREDLDVGEALDSDLRQLEQEAAG